MASGSKAHAETASPSLCSEGLAVIWHRSALVLVDEFQGTRCEHGEAQEKGQQVQPVDPDIPSGIFIGGVDAALGRLVLQQGTDSLHADPALELGIRGPDGKR